MAVFYTNERARFGGVTGTIIPFPIRLPAGNVPDEGDWKKYLPAGFLRCNGEILDASQFPVLAQVLGTGTDSKFKKFDQLVTNNQFVLPDIGSKYVQGGNASGAYLNDKVVGQENGPYRVGAEVNVVSLIGNQTTLTYSGNFEVISAGPQEFVGNPTFNTTTTDGRTLKSFLSDTAFQAHGHDANVGVFTYLGGWSDSQFVNGSTGNSIGGNDGQNEGSNELIQIDSPTTASAVVSHAHLIDFPTSTEVAESNALRYSFLNTEIDAFGLESTVTLTTSNVKKLDEATPPYILVEYIIKI